MDSLTATGQDEAALAVASFAQRLHGRLLRSGDSGYDEARTLWNAMIDRYPALIAQCVDTADVQAGVNFAREHDLLLSVRGGGHNIAGNAVCNGGLMLDLSPMKRIEVDPATRTARAEPGVVWGEFDAATQEHGLATTGGAVSSTGIAGLTLGGGYGLLIRRCGLTCDNLLSAQVVTADGEVRTANAAENPDLYWALRGGGGNFGVVTEFTYQLHEIGPEVLGGLVLHPIERAREVFQFYRDFAANAPDELVAIAGLMTDPDGARMLAIVVCYAGPLDDGERAIAPLRAFGLPTADLVTRMSYTAMQQLFDPGYPYGRRNYWKSSFIDELTDAAIDTLIEHFTLSTAPSAEAALEHFGGAAGRISADATAFRQRGAIFNLNVTSSWTDPADDATHIQWTRGLWQAMQPFTRTEGYINYFDDSEQNRVQTAYGTSYARLQAIKAEYDPGNLFRVNQNIVPKV